MRFWIKLPLYTKIFIGAVIGIILGFILQDNASFFEPIGDLFIKLLQMLIIPLVVFSILSGILKMKDAKSLGKIGGTFISYLIISGLFSAIFGVLIGIIMQPGKNVESLLKMGEEVEESDFSFVEHFLSWVPENIFDSLAEMEMIQIILFTVLIGIVMLTLGSEKLPMITKFVEEGTSIMMKLTDFIIKLSPYGILALLANLVGTLGSDMITAALKFIIADYIGVILVLLIVYPIIIRFVLKLSPLHFFKNIYPSMLFAASTSTSTATIPVSYQVSKNNLGIDEKVYGFTVPFGATVNMDGFAVAIGVISVFSANLYGIPITFSMILQFVLLGLVLSIGAAGVRGAGVVMSIVLLETLGMPLDIVAVLAAVWPIIDIGHTTLNITGDLVGTTVTAKAGDKLNLDTFHAKNAPLDK